MGRPPRPADIYALVHPEPDPREPAGNLSVIVPDGLQQGRGAWGGVATGLMTWAAVQVAPELPVRNVTAQLLAPLLVGPARTQARVLRRGSATVTVAITLHGQAGAAGGDGVLAHAVVVMGAPRRGADLPDGPVWLGLTPPADLAAGSQGVPVARLGPPLAPQFANQLEFRPVMGVPFQGEPLLETAGWIRPLADVPSLDAAVVAALADAWWVAAMVPLARPRPAATLGYSLDLPTDPAVLGHTGGPLPPLFHRGRIVAARAGYVSETRELWTQGGDLLSWNVQTVAVIA